MTRLQALRLMKERYHEFILDGGNPTRASLGEVNDGWRRLCTELPDQIEECCRLVMENDHD